MTPSIAVATFLCLGAVNVMARSPWAWLPQQVPSFSQQCLDRRAGYAGACEADERIICAHLLCGKNSHGRLIRINTLNLPAPGTRCGNRKVCDHGQCVEVSWGTNVPTSTGDPRLHYCATSARRHRYRDELDRKQTLSDY